MDVSGQLHAAAAPPPYPLNRRLGGPQRYCRQIFEGPLQPCNHGFESRCGHCVHSVWYVVSRCLIQAAWRRSKLDTGCPSERETYHTTVSLYGIYPNIVIPFSCFCSVSLEIFLMFFRTFHAPLSSEFIFTYLTLPKSMSLFVTPPSAFERAIKWVSGSLTLGANRPVREADHLLPSNAEVKNERNYTSAKPSILMSWCLIKHRNNVPWFALHVHGNREIVHYRQVSSDEL